MSKPIVLVTRKIPEAGIDFLKQLCEVRGATEATPIDHETLMKSISDVDALLCLLTDTIDHAVIEAGSRLKVISNYAVGFDNIDVEAATERGIMVTNTPGVLTEATAELTWALIFAVARKIVPADKYVRDHQFSGWDPLLMLGYEIHGKTLGIIGMGRIGQAVAQMSVGFGMNIVYHDCQSPKLDLGSSVRSVTLEELGQLADIITIHVPLTPQTHHLCDADFFRLCKPGALFINTARGPVVDEEALVEALKERILAGAGLDVYEHEPAVHPGLFELPNVVLLPHIGSATYHTRTNMALRAAQNIIDAVTGKRPAYLVNPAVLNKLAL
ncbi:2-hydroxyacid dehydrogenase [candidate division CSSED10-310 bacterium]|uniref:2-hydroxyacid dehydrogenase n=1 Tax=candidate division CSSED10-310 bacterium TaxID=2855610 RepID=A0ABV6YVN0_UNCC1